MEMLYIDVNMLHDQMCIMLAELHYVNEITLY